jgi:hypothetical protein
MSLSDDNFDAEWKAPKPAGLVRFDAIGESWAYFRERWGVWCIATAIAMLGNALVLGFVSSVFGLPRPRGGGLFPMFGSVSGNAVQMAVMFIVNGFFLGGMQRMACLQVRGHEIRVTTLFSVTDYLANLALGALFYGLAWSVGLLFCVIPGLVAEGVLMFTIPLIVDGGLSATDAVSQSWHSLKGQWPIATVFHMVLTWICLVSLCCGVGILVTGPLYCLAIAILYRDFFLAKGPAYGPKPSPPEPEF